MAFAVSSAAERAGKYSVRVVSTPEEALARARHLLDCGSAEVLIMIDGIGSRFSVDQFEAAFGEGKVPVPETDKTANMSKIDPRYQSH